MKLGSLFDGIGGFPLAAVMCGITPVWSSEIKPFPLKVTAARFPDMKQLGSVTDINGAKVEPVDIITFGSPCQDLSVAGKRLGIHEGQRSNLFFEAVRIIKEMRDADKTNGRTGADIRPQFAVWENVPGAFSSNKGEDFKAVLETLAGVRQDGLSIPRPKKWGGAGCVVGDGWSLAWRVYDAQYWGVPQRRKRIYLVADFGSERAGEILFERESMRGDSAESRETREGTVADAERCVGGSDSVKCLNPWDCQSKCIFETDGKYPTLAAYRSRCGIGDGVCYPNIAQTLTAEHDGSWCPDKGPNVICIGNGQTNNISMKPIANTLDAMDHQQNIMYESDKPNRKYIVRRLTPIECARLQGFPDWWCEGLGGSVSAKYNAYGNGLALPCAYDVISRIEMAAREA